MPDIQCISLQFIDQLKKYINKKSPALSVLTPQTLPGWDLVQFDQHFHRPSNSNIDLVMRLKISGVIS